MGWVTHFGADPWSWNLESYEDDDQDEADSDGSGMPGVALIGAAIFAWLGLQARPVAIVTAAETFNLSADLTRKAVNNHQIMWVEDGDRMSRPFGVRVACLDAERDDDQWVPDISLSNAISVWASLRDDMPTVETAAMTFMISPDRVRLAVDEHPWMFLGAGDVIEHDGD